MKRTALARGKPLARGKALSRGTRLAPVNRERRAQLHEDNFGERGPAVREMGCSVAARAHLAREGWTACWGGIEAAHSKARKAGGRAHGKDGKRWLWGACHGHHEEAGEYRTSKRKEFVKRYRFSPVAESKRVAAELDERGLP